ncbi:YdcF family protein [Sphingomonas sinipercae]|uniref:YdcF family protein n=1 Tax=Sphingomonas sinipercae TaxID=2714944 RepID=UPI001FED0FA4|nr:YdcF family protein [Sphingomonas sinipercae]
MIARFLAFLLLLYALGFILFAVTLGRPATAGKTDAAVVLTGGSGRIEHAMDVLLAKKARRLLISGVDPSVTKPDLAARLGKKRSRLLNCCVDLDSVSVDTRSNAEETGRWLDKHGYRSFRLITSDWHMRRARYEFARVLDDRYEVVPDAARTQPSFLTLFAEYNKYLLRRVAVLLEL